MRYPSDHKGKSRRNIVAVAAREFRRRGIDGVGVGDVMKEAGLTKGAFSAHFSSKNELIKEALQEAAVTSLVFDMSDTDRTLEEMVNLYLSPHHCEHPEQGCPFPSLAAEVARYPKRTREGLVSYLKKLMAFIAARLPESEPPEARHKAALVMFSTMLGAMQLARVTAGHKISNELLAAAREAVLKHT